MKKKQSPYALHISILFLFAALFAYVKLPPVGAAGIVYVDVDSTCSSSCGGSWAEAHPNLQDALATAVSGDQIWVTQGIYYPDIGGGMSPNDRSATFTLLNGVAIYGGFAGNESSLDERNITANPTLLSGDIEKNDITDPGGVVTDTTNIVGDNVYLSYISTS